MNKLFTKIAALCLGATMAVGVGVAVASVTKEASSVSADSSITGYDPVSSIAAGDVVYFTYVAGGTPQVLTSVTSGTKGDVTAISNKTMNTTYPLTVGKSGNNYTFKDKNNKYIAFTSTSTSGNNKLWLADSATANGATWTVSFSGTTATIVNVYNNKRTLRGNTTSGQYRICGYTTTTGNLLTLYKEASSDVTVTFNANGHGTAPSSQTVSSGGKATQPTAPTATGWTFGGWYKEQACTNAWNFSTDTVSTDTTLWAKWTANKYNINYYDQGGSPFTGSHESGYPTQHTYGTATTLKSATKGGYSFDGWFTTSACTGSAVTSLGATSYTAAISLYAKWTATGTTYSISTTVTNGTYSGDTTITDNGGVASVTIAPTGDYKLPTSVSVSGASHTYNAETGVISLSGATGNVTISAAMVALTEYSITVNETNGSHTGASTIKESRTASLTFTPASGFGQPSSVTVSGATSSWTRGTGVLSLSNPTGNVTVTYVAVGNELDSITISTNSGSYTLGDNFVMPTVTAKYTVNADADVTSSASYSGYDPYTTGNQNVTISYTEGGITKTQSYTANVSAASVQTTTYYQKCTSMSDIVNGGKYVLIGYKEATTTYYAMPSYSSGNNIQGATVTLTENETRLTEANMSTAAVYTLTSTGTTNQYYIGDGSQYLYAAGSGTNNHLKGKASTDSSAGAFTISYSTFFSVVAASSNRNTMRFNASNNPPIFSCYASDANQTEIMFFKEVKEQSGSADLIRITASFTPSETKYAGDSISTSDFTVQKQYNTGETLSPVTSGFTISANTLASTHNVITVSYTEGGITETFDVVIDVEEVTANVESVTLVQGVGVVKEYVDWSGAAWDYTGLTVHCAWDDSSYNEDFDLEDLIQSGDASVSPAKPSVGVTSFTVSFTYHDVDITSNSVTGISVVADYVDSVSWTSKSLSHFKAFSGEQLTASTVSTWVVKATYAGAGESDALSFGTGASQFTIRIGDSKSVTSLPYTWTTADDNQFVYVVVGGVAKGDSTHAKTNICASINAIDHTEIITPASEEVVNAYVRIGSTAEITSGGKYLIVYEGDSTHASVAFDGSLSTLDATSNGQSVSISDNRIAIPANDDFYFTITEDDGVYSIVTADGSNVGHSGTKNGMNCSDSTNHISFDEDGYATIVGSGGLNLRYNYASDQLRFRYYTSTQQQVAIYKYINETIHHDAVTETTHYANNMDHFDAQKKVVEFAKFMNTTMNGTNVCSGTFANLESAWDDVADKYDELFGASTTLNETELAWAKKMLEYASPVWGSDAEAACVEKAMKTYDHCASKYGLDDFLDGVRTVGRVQNLNPLINLADGNNNVITIAVVISLVSVTAIGGYFFLRKRKEN